MPVDYSTWLGRMANSIEDGSIVNTKVSSTPKLTEKQKRLLMADVIVPNTYNTMLVLDWLSIFCIKYAGDTTALGSRIKSVLGEQLYEEYINLDGDYDHVIWVSELKRSINRGEIL